MGQGQRWQRRRRPRFHGAETSCPFKPCSRSHCPLSGRGSPRGAALTCDLLAVRTAGEFIASITRVWNQVSLMSVMGWPAGRRRVWGSWGCVQREVHCGKIRRGRAKPGGTHSSASPGGSVPFEHVFWVEEEPPARGGGGGGLPSRKTDIHVHIPVSPSAACQPCSRDRHPPPQGRWRETCRVSFPAFPLTFSAFRGWAIPKAIAICSVAFL